MDTVHAPVDYNYFEELQIDAASVAGFCESL
jgi:hypothetical protein